MILFKINQTKQMLDIELGLKTEFADLNNSLPLVANDSDLYHIVYLITLK